MIKHFFHMALAVILALGAFLAPSLALANSCTLQRGTMFSGPYAGQMVAFCGTRVMTQADLAAEGINIWHQKAVEARFGELAAHRRGSNYFDDGPDGIFGTPDDIEDRGKIAVTW